MPITRRATPATDVLARTPPRSEPWSRHARQWDRVGSPLRPVAEDAQAVFAEIRGWSESHAGRGPRALLLGVTPELATLPWPVGTSLIAADRSAAMIEDVFPREGLPSGARALCCDWRALPLDAGSIDVAVGDGCFSVFAFPDEARAFAREMRRVLAGDGVLVIRVFAAPEEPEPLANVERELAGGEIGSFHALKWRLAMALQRSPERGVVLRDIHAACGALAPALEALASRPGFEPETVATIEAYRDSEVAYSFPSARALEGALSDLFSVTASHAKSYELGERCPTLVLRPR